MSRHGAQALWGRETMAGMAGPGGVSPDGGAGVFQTPGRDAAAGLHGGLDPDGHPGMDLGGVNMLTGSSFELNHETRRGGILSFWSRGAQSQFAGREGELSLDGRVRTTMFGADYAKGPLVTGLSLSHSRGLGSYDGGDGLSDRDGVLLGARKAADRLHLEGLVASAVPVVGAIAVSGSMLLGRSSGLPPFVVHVKPVAVPQPDYGARHVAALILIVEPGSQHRIDPDLVARTLGLTPMESRVAAGLAEGRSVDEMAGAMGNTKHAVYWHLQRIYRKLSISRQAELVRLVLSLADLG